MRVEIDTESKRVKVLDDIEISVLAKELAQYLGTEWQTWTMVGSGSNSCKAGLDNISLV